MRKNQENSILIPYHIVTPILLGVLFFWNDLQPLFRWMSGRITLPQLMQKMPLDQVPILPMILPALTLVVILCAISFYYRWRAKKELRVIQIIPSTDIAITSSQVDNFVLDVHKRHRSPWMRLWKGREWFGYLIHVNEKQQVIFYFLYPQDKQNGVKRSIQNHFPGCTIRDRSFQHLPLPQRDLSFGGGHFLMNRKGKRAGLPLQRFNESQLGSVYCHMAPHTWLWMQFSPNLTNKKLEERVGIGLKSVGMSKRDLERLFHLELDKPTRTISELTPTERARYHSLYKQHTGREKSFQVAMCLWSQHPDHDVYVQDTKASIERVMEMDNYIYMKKKWLFPKFLNPLFTAHPIPNGWHQMTWSHTELGNLIHLPVGTDHIYQLPDNNQDRPYVKTSVLDDDEFQEGILVGTLEGDKEREVRIPYKQWTYMGFGAGATGFGKSAIFLQMMYSMIEQWIIDPQAPGFTFIDPKGDSSFKLLAKILSDFNQLEKQGIDVEELKQRIHYFDLASTKYILGLNLLHQTDGETDESIVNAVMDLIKNAYATDSMWFDKLGQMALYALLLDEQPHSILGMEQILRKDPTFRNRVLPSIKGTLYELDWEENIEAIEQGHVVLPILNRMQKIRLNTRMRRLFGQHQMDLQPATWMDESHLCIFNVAGLSEEERRIAVGFIVSRYHLDAQKRTYKSKIHPHLVDEFSLIQLPIVKQIYAIDRYTGHCLVPMAQYVDQLKQDIRYAVDGNAATLIACNQGSKSADAMVEMSGGQLDKKAIQKLPKLSAFVSTRDSEGERIIFQIRTKPPYLYNTDGIPTYFGKDQIKQEQEEKEVVQMAKQFGEAFMQRDCTPANEVDQWIEQYGKPRTLLQKEKENEESVSSETIDKPDSDEDYNLPLY